LVVQAPADKAKLGDFASEKKRKQHWFCKGICAWEQSKPPRVNEKFMEKIFFAYALTGQSILYTADGLGAEISYPLFLWITMCMNQ